MNAVVLRELGGPDKLVLSQVPDPVPGPGEVLVRLRAAALNRRDAWITQGLYAGIKLPIILGSDGAGDVRAVGAGVDPAWVGRDVVINPSLDWGESEKVQGPKYRILGLPDDGTYAQYVKVPVVNLVPKPTRLSWTQAAAIPLAGLTAYRALVTRAQLRPGETVLITGIGGGVATFALLFARHFGARVFVTSGSDTKIAQAKELGAEDGRSYKHPFWGKELQALIGGGGPDVIIDSAGHDSFATATEIAKPGGRIVSFGATSGSPSTVEVRRIFWKQLSILGTTMGTPNEFREMVRLFEDGSLQPVIDRVFPLAEASLAHHRMDGLAQFGKIVLAID
jgi:zinc-binding alcohol dehydrogenase/oxidoreductase